MNIMILVPKVAQNYISQFPETWHNAYDYFNYDNRVVEERVPRGDEKRSYQGPDDLTNNDYDDLVGFARTKVNPILAKYSPRVACEDALTTAIRSFKNGLFDGKVNANRYDVLIKAMLTPPAPIMPVMAKDKKEKKKEAPQKEKRPSVPVLRGLGIKKVTDLPVDTPARKRIRERAKGDISVVRKPGRGLIIEK